MDTALAPSPANFLRALLPLGLVRVMLRNCAGFAELFCSTDAFSVDGDWLNLRAGHAHLHVHLADLRGAQVQEPPHGAPIVQIIGRCGSPSLLLICDQTSGQAWREQMAVVDALRSRFGARCMFSSDDHAPSPALLH